MTDIFLLEDIICKASTYIRIESIFQEKNCTLFYMNLGYWQGQSQSHNLENIESFVTFFTFVSKKCIDFIYESR